MHVTSYIGRWNQTLRHDVRIELERPSATYEPGEAIAGGVHVTAAHDDVTEGSTIELQLHAHGTVTAIAVAAQQALFAGPFFARHTGYFPFSLQAPRTAGPYFGKLFNLELRLAAVLPTPAHAKGVYSLVTSLTGHSMAHDRARAHPAAVQPIRVQPDARPLVVTTTVGGARHRGVIVVLGVVFALMAVASAIVTWAMVAEIILLPSLFIALGPGFGALLFGVIAWAAFHKELGPWRAERAIGIPTIAGRSVPSSDGLALEISVRVRRGAAVSAVYATLVVFEETTVSAGSSTYTEEHVVAERAVQLAPAHEPGLHAATLPPAAVAGLPPCIGLRAARIGWRLEVRIDRPRGPSWTGTQPLEAYPGGDRPTRPAPYSLVVQ
jgi:hypothetical protein